MRGKLTTISQFSVLIFSPERFNSLLALLVGGKPVNLDQINTFFSQLVFCVLDSPF